MWQHLKNKSSEGIVSHTSCEQADVAMIPAMTLVSAMLKKTETIDEATEQFSFKGNDFTYPKAEM